MKIDMNNVFVNGWVVEALGRAGLISPPLIHGPDFFDVDSGFHTITSLSMIICSDPM